MVRPNLLGRMKDDWKGLRRRDENYPLPFGKPITNYQLPNQLSDYPTAETPVTPH
jgi:hypothetical protein